MGFQPTGRHKSILIVDDTPANLRLLKQMLSERGYKVRAVTSGQRALEAVRTAPPDLVLLDIKMPDMDGYEVCRQLKADEQTQSIPIIFISALDETQDKVKAFTVGGVDYVTKPLQIEEVLARVETHLTLRELQRQLQEANERFERELALAGQIQASFLPSELPAVPGWQLSVTLKPARETSGDYYDIRLLPKDQLGILVADVVDKGIGAALTMALSCTLIRTFAAKYVTQPEETLNVTNQRMLKDTDAGQFITVFYGILDPATGTLIYANGGHNPPFVVRAEDGTAQPLTKTGMALGVIEDETWQQGTVQLGPGDVLVLYTDGITDAQNEQEAFFGEDRLLAAIKANLGRSAREIRDAIVDAVYRFVGSAPQYDDIALVVVARDDAASLSE